MQPLALAAGMLASTIGAAFAQTPRTITYTLNASQKVSLNIYNSSGQIVRELLHTAARTAGSKTEQWDGRDDAGNPAPAGNYTWKMLSTPGFGVEYITSPGANYPTAGQGFIDSAPGCHGGPSVVAVDSTGFYVGAASENVDAAMTKVSLDGNTKLLNWTNRTAMTAPVSLAVVGNTLWNLYPDGNAYRNDKNTGADISPAINATYNGEQPTDMAANATNLIFSYKTQGVVRWLDLSGAQVRSVNVANAKTVDVAPNGTVYVITGPDLSIPTGTAISKIAVGNTSATAFVTTGLVAPRRAAVNPTNGDLYVADMPQYLGGQVKRYSSAGALLAAYGAVNGRTYGGQYQNKKTDFSRVADIAVEADGKFWVAEAEAAPRRVARFNLDGTWIKEWYGGQAWAPFIMPEPDNPNFVWMCSSWGSMMRCEVDYTNKTWKVDSTYYYHTMADGLIENHFDGATWQARVHAGDLFLCRGAGLYMLKVDRTNRQLIPVTATVGAFWQSGPYLPAWVNNLAGGNQSLLWTDANGDGRPLNANGTPQTSELQFFAAQAADQAGSYIDENFNWVTSGGVRKFPVTSWNGAGNPVYGNFPAGVAGVSVPAGWIGTPADRSSYAASDDQGNIWGAYNLNTNTGGVSSDVFMARWNPNGTLAWKSGRQNGKPGSLGTVRRIFGFVNNGTNYNCMVAGRYSSEWPSEGVTPIYVYDQDGLYAGQLLGKPVNQGTTPNWKYALGGEGLAGQIMKHTNGKVYLFGHWINEGRVYEITGWNNWQRASGSVSIPAGYTAPTFMEEPSGPNGNGTGLKGEYFADNYTWSGTPVLTRVDPVLDFNWPYSFTEPITTQYGQYSVRWTGTLTPRRSGWHMFQQSEGNMTPNPPFGEIWVNDVTVSRGGTGYNGRALYLEAGQAYSIRVDWNHMWVYTGDIHMEWAEPETNGNFTLIPQSQLSPGPIVQTNSSSSSSQTAFPVSSTDLINAGQPTLLSRTDSGYTAYGGSSTAKLNDGSPGTTSNVATTAFDLDGTWTSVFNLDTSSNTFGYDISQIDSYSGWTDARVNQQFTLSYTTVAEPTPASLGTFTYSPGALGTNGATKLSLTRTGSYLATGVKSLIFSFLSPGSGAETVYREIDAFGVPTVGSSMMARSTSMATESSQASLTEDAEPESAGQCDDGSDGSDCETDF